MAQDSFSGPEELSPRGLAQLAPGVWLTGGRAALVLAGDSLILIDPGDEPFDALVRDLASVTSATGSPLGMVALTHAHPDHVANLPRLLEWSRSNLPRGPVRVAAHENSPLPRERAIGARTTLGSDGSLLAIPLKGHSPWGDDLAFFHPATGVLFSGDLVQPKGESWERAFYPSPYPYFTDGDAYLRSLEILAELDFSTLLTGHRELRRGPAARAWVELTRRAISSVEAAVEALGRDADPMEGARRIFAELCRQRAIPEEVVARRISPPGDSAFDRFDLPGIRFFREKHFPDG